MKAKQKYFKIISSFLVCVCLLCIFHADAYAQNADVQQGDESSEEYVTARVVIGNTSRALGDPNADVDGDGVRLRSGPSQVLYYNFTFGNGELVQISSSSMKRLYNREWVVTVDSAKNNRYGITYGIFDNNASEWYNSLVSYTTGRTGTGNFGGRYYGSDTVGCYLYLGAMIDERDVNRGVVTSGQWSTDDSK